MPTATIKLFAQYRENRFKVEVQTFCEGTTAQMIMDALKLTEQLPLGVLMANGKHVEPEYLLQEGDEIAIFPKVGGG